MYWIYIKSITFSGKQVKIELNLLEDTDDTSGSMYVSLAGTDEQGKQFDEEIEMTG